MVRFLIARALDRSIILQIIRTITEIKALTEQSKPGQRTADREARAKTGTPAQQKLAEFHS
jgi:hypothetical protein